MSITDRLDEIQKQAKDRTCLACENCGFADENADGKWWRCTICGHDEYESDVPSVADAQTLTLVAALRAVLELHKARDGHGLNLICDGCSDEDDEDAYLYYDSGPTFIVWPCPTVRAVESALGGAS